MPDAARLRVGPKSPTSADLGDTQVMGEASAIAQRVSNATDWTASDGNPLKFTLN